MDEKKMVKDFEEIQQRKATVAHGLLLYFARRESQLFSIPK